jgi:hypothetical protein
MTNRNIKSLPSLRAIRKNLPLIILSLLFASLFSYGALGRQESHSIATDHGQIIKVETIDRETIPVDSHILCVGDSLTAGMTGFGRGQPDSPYALFLEAALKNRTLLSNGDDISITHRGFPGWESGKLLEAVTTILAEEGNQNIDLLILLAGTNDILDRQFNNYNISQRVIALHETAYELNVSHTIAVEIPGSKSYKKHPDQCENVVLLTQNLKQFSDSESRATFAPFPFPYNEDDDRWSKDGV